MRAEALRAQGMSDAACKQLAAALQLDPDNQDVIKRLKKLRAIVTDTARVKAAIEAAIGKATHHPLVVLRPHRSLTGARASEQNDLKATTPPRDRRAWG